MPLPSPPLTTKFQFHRPPTVCLSRPLCWPLGSISGAICATYNACSKLCAYVRPPLLLCPLQFFPRRDCNDCPAHVVGVLTSPPLRQSRSQQGGTPRPPRGRIPPRPFQGGPLTCPNPRQASQQCPQLLPLLPPSSSSSLSLGLPP
jgi:hypothetical protein